MPRKPIDPWDNVQAPKGLVAAVIILLAIFMMTGRPAQASGFAELRVSTQRTQLVLQETLIPNKLLRTNVGTRIDYEYEGALPDLELFANVKTYQDDGSSLGFEVQAFLDDQQDPGRYRLSYELSTLIGVRW